MDYITLKEYAEKKHISYEAVRKQVIRYQDELKDHIIRKNKTQFLDEWAVAFLSERRRESPIVLTTENQSEQIEKLTAELADLREKLMSAQNELLAAKDRIIDLQDSQKLMIESQVKYAALLEDHAAQERKLHDAEIELTRLTGQHETDQEQLDKLQREKDQAEAEANSYYRSFFGFYRKR